MIQFTDPGHAPLDAHAEAAVGDGAVAAQVAVPVVVRVLDAALDQFGPHSRIIAPWQVQSDYNFVRGGDIDEIKIHDRALGDDAIAALARGEEPPALAADDDRAARLRAFLHRYGFDRADEPPPVFSARASIRPTASSSVICSGVLSFGRLALTPLWLTYGP